MGILMRYYVWGGICDVVVSIKSYFLRHRTHLIPLSWIHPNFICFFVPLLRRDDKCERIKIFVGFLLRLLWLILGFFSKMPRSEEKWLLRSMTLFWRELRLGAIHKWSRDIKGFCRTFIWKKSWKCLSRGKFKFFFGILSKIPPSKQWHHLLATPRHINHSIFDFS